MKIISILILCLLLAMECDSKELKCPKCKKVHGMGPLAGDYYLYEQDSQCIDGCSYRNSDGECCFCFVPGGYLTTECNDNDCLIPCGNNGECPLDQKCCGLVGLNFTRCCQSKDIPCPEVQVEEEQCQNSVYKTCFKSGGKCQYTPSSYDGFCCPEGSFNQYCCVSEHKKRDCQPFETSPADPEPSDDCPIPCENNDECPLDQICCGPIGSQCCQSNDKSCGYVQGGDFCFNPLCNTSDSYCYTSQPQGWVLYGYGPHGEVECLNDDPQCKCYHKCQNFKPKNCNNPESHCYVPGTEPTGWFARGPCVETNVPGASCTCYQAPPAE